MTIPDPSTAPAIPPKVRTVAYFVALGVGGVAYVATGITAIVAPAAAATAFAISGVVSGGVALVAGALGVAYRPTAAPAPVVKR